MASAAGLGWPEEPRAPGGRAGSWPGAADQAGRGLGWPAAGPGGPAMPGGLLSRMVTAAPGTALAAAPEAGLAAAPGLASRGPGGVHP
ncbi:MAG: hypothetical protein ACHP9Z_34770, partial [Streptosporangiales bacterium]